MHVTMAMGSLWLMYHKTGTLFKQNDWNALKTAKHVCTLHCSSLPNMRLCLGGKCSYTLSSLCVTSQKLPIDGWAWCIRLWSTGSFILSWPLLLLIILILYWFITNCNSGCQYIGTKPWRGCIAKCLPRNFCELRPICEICNKMFPLIFCYTT